MDWLHQYTGVPVRDTAMTAPDERTETTVAAPRPGRRWLQALVVLAVTTGLGLAGGFFAFVAHLAREEVSAGTHRADAIVALTGGAQRIGEAVELLAHGAGRRLLISGVHARTTSEELARATPDLQAWVNCCVDLDYRARNTIGNAIETRRWLNKYKFASLIVVTSNYHMPRSLLELSHVLPGVSLVAHPVVPDNGRLENWWRDPAKTRLLVTEYGKFLAAWLRMRIEADPERSATALLAGGRKPVYEVP
jgi:uncharacterized SAM-binding protein YcdF (DUF218 family)